MSAETQGYIFKDGGYWRLSDGTGPYAYDGVSTFTLITWNGQTQVGRAGVTYQDRGFFSSADGSGPKSVS